MGSATARSSRTRSSRRRSLWSLPRDLAVMLLNTALLLALLELALVVISTLGSSTLGVSQGSFDDLRQHYLALAAYREQSWAAAYWDEIEAVADMPYQPFLTWRTRPFEGRWVRVDDEGIRHTPGSEPPTPPNGEGRPFEVWVFGGSTVWGWGSPDHGTLPAHLQRRLSTALAAPVRVVNLGENGYVASQGLLRLEEGLRNGQRPDLVLFYDGVNDVMGAYHDGVVGSHQNLALYQQRYGQHENPLRTALSRLMIARWLARLGHDSTATPASDPASLARQIASHHVAVLDTVASLGRSFGFAHHASWQPHITTGHKLASAEERPMAEALAWTVALDPPLVELFRASARELGELARQRTDLTSLVDVFDQHPETIWIDTWGHVTPAGNDLVAARLGQRLGELGLLPPTNP